MNQKEPYYQYWPEDVPKTIELPKKALDANLRETANKYPDAIALTYHNLRLSYKELDEIVDRLSTYFSKELDINKGETVALHFNNIPPCIPTYYGILRSGARVTMLAPLFREMEIEYQLNDSDAKVLIIWDEFAQTDDKIVPKTDIEIVLYSSLKNWLQTSPLESISEDIKKSSKIYLESIIKTTDPNPPLIKIEPEKDLACLQYTGGTTGLPKGAMLTHHNLVSNVEQYRTWFQEAKLGKEVMLTALPLYHIYAQTVAMNLSVRLAANQIIVSNAGDTKEVLKAIDKHKVTIFPGVPTLYNSIINFSDLDKYDLKSINICLSGGGSLPLKVQEKFEAILGAKLRDGYGLTEASPVTHVNPFTRMSKNGTIGLPLPNTKMKLIDVESNEIITKPNITGELCVKGPQVMLGYYKRPEETKNTIINDWLHTGDVALFDEDGYTVIKARLKNMIKYKGHSVYPAEIEALLLKNERILESAVIGVPAEVGETIRAYVVLKPDYQGKVSEEEIIEWTKENIAPYKYPREVVFIKEIPKTNVGKISHLKLREGNYE
ncbi:MAG: AMP-binding protein [Candidatus Lokiarchaeota archaeon]|nr:AMP-binding protein [Candidatus Lokiarchaeota archaeon]MBD3201457.1 AMP-binding protein [Candidatus Lokiarchaeota archaeon]